jgi:8-oxo-dGTP pyrophosphatase MutT (NUDIX family)
MSGTQTRSDSIEHLHNTLTWLKNNPCPYVAGPESTKKRASVALIIRIHPSYAHQPDKTAVPTDSIDSFFAQEWVKHGQAEVLFIKRAARKGDRWTSHVALPGGRRDPEDKDDQHAAIREAVEEVGIDLSGRNCIAVGNLPQRVVTTSWGRVPLMVLCPYVFLVTRHDLPPLRLQPTEVASTHWVPIRSLLNPSQRTVHTEDVSNRLANQEKGFKRLALGLMLGEMEFSAIQLLPTESLYCHESPIDDANIGLPRRIIEKLVYLFDPPIEPLPPQRQPLILWGLTLGVVADFLDLLPPHNALELWTYPTFTMSDIRAVIWLTTYNFRRNKRLQLESEIHLGPSAAAAGEGQEAVLVPDNEHRERCNEVGMEGLSSGRSLRGHSFESAVGTMLDGYYACMRRGVTYALALRVFGIASVAALLWFKRPSPAALAKVRRFR